MSARILALGCALGAWVAAWAAYQPWHEVHESRAFEELSCIGLDVTHCPPDAPYQRTATVDSGADHAGDMPAVLLAIAALIALVPAVRPARRIALVCGAASVELITIAGVLMARATFLTHMLDKVERRAGGSSWTVAMLVAFGCAVAQAISSSRDPSRRRRSPAESPPSPSS